jgi:DNA repair exonuclease SbcCD ATPase subunit
MGVCSHAADIGVDRMSTVTDSDLKRLEELILNGQKVMESRFTMMETRFTAIENNLEELKTDVKTLEVSQKALEAGQAEIAKALEVGQTEIKGEIRTLEAKIDGLEKRTEDINGRLNSVTLGFLHGDYWHFRKNCFLS